jgi:hypothetical protein
MDVDGDREVSDTEAAAWRDAACASDRDALHLSPAGISLALTVDASALSFPMGQGALTARLGCQYHAAAPPLGARSRELRMDDLADPSRVGWREIVVVGHGTLISHSDALAASVSRRLTAYPTDLLAAPRTSAISLASLRGHRLTQAQRRIRAVSG